MPNSGESLVEEKKVWLTALACFLGGMLAVKSFEWLLSTINNKSTTKKEDLSSNNNNNKSEVINQQLSSNKQQQDKIEVDDEEDEDLEEEEDWEDDEEEEEDEHKKMLLLVRTDINMQKGKMCAQCGHAALGAHRSIHYRYSKNPNEINKQHLQWLNQWHKYGAAKIAVKVNGQEMDKFQKLAKEKNLPTYRVLDAGKTQIEAGTATVLAIGPCPDSLLDFTKQLKLFGSTTINGSGNNYNNLSPTSPLVKRTFSCYSPTTINEELLSTARLQQKDLSFVTTNLTQEFINFDLTNGDNGDNFTTNNYCDNYCDNNRDNNCDNFIKNNNLLFIEEEEKIISSPKKKRKYLNFLNLPKELKKIIFTNCFKNATEFGSFMTILCENKTLQNLHISTYYSSPNAFEIFLQKNKNCKQFIAEFNDKSKLLILNVNCFLFLENNLNLKILKLINFDLNDENLFFNEILWKLNHIDIELKRDSFESSFSQ
ncbi:hypothetical protein ABK040_008641 [Willaertia magna]